jgi:predicted dehydrogenase
MEQGTVTRIGLIGCGIISGAHLRAYGHAGDRARVAICCDTREEVARQAAEGIGARWTTSAEDVLNDPEIDAVDICLPHHLHAPIAIAAARAGKHILCEKPLATTIEDCDAMIAAAREAGVVLFHGENMRSSPAVRSARAAIDAGKVGRVVAIQTSYTHWQPERLIATGWRVHQNESGGGALADGGIHWVDILRHLGGDVARVSGFVSQVRPEHVLEDLSVVNLEFASGAMGQLLSTHAAGAWGPGTLFTVWGTEGAVSAGGAQGGLVLYRKDLPDGKQSLAEDSWGDSFAAMVAHFLDVVQRGEELRHTPEDGRENLRVVLAAYESARSGEAVRIGGTATG